MVIELERHKIPHLKSPIRMIDYVLGLFPQTKTKNSVKKAIKREQLLLNGKITATGTWMQEGDVITFVDPLKGVPRPYEANIEILFEDDSLALVNKPPGIRVSGNYYKTLENCMIDVIVPSDENDGYRWARPVHRLDIPTQGIVVFAKSLKMHQKLSHMFETRQIHKTYLAVVVGAVQSQEVKQTLDGKSGLTKIKVLQTTRSHRNDFLSLVELNPITGRTHQLRRHCAGIGHPIVGDETYGVEGKTLLHKGLFLASTAISFVHPETGIEVNTSINPPHKFNALIEREESRWRKFNVDGS